MYRFKARLYQDAINSRSNRAAQRAQKGPSDRKREIRHPWLLPAHCRKHFDFVQSLYMSRIGPVMRFNPASSGKIPGSIFEKLSMP